MWWFIVTLVGFAVAVAALWWWGRTGRDVLDDGPGIVPSGRERHKARAWEILLNKGNGSGDAGPG